MNESCRHNPLSSIHFIFLTHFLPSFWDYSIQKSMFYEQIKVMGITFCLTIYLPLICSHFLSFIIFIIYPTLSKHKHTWGFCFWIYNSEYNKLHIQKAGKLQTKNGYQKSCKRFQKSYWKRERERVYKSWIGIRGRGKKGREIYLTWQLMVTSRPWMTLVSIGATSHLGGTETRKRKADRERKEI